MSARIIPPVSVDFIDLAAAAAFCICVLERVMQGNHYSVQEHGRPLGCNNLKGLLAKTDNTFQIFDQVLSTRECGMRNKIESRCSLCFGINIIRKGQVFWPV